ncbi:putative alkylated DNA repair protein AlkB [Helianthus anomalus]
MLLCTQPGPETEPETEPERNRTRVGALEVSPGPAPGSGGSMSRSNVLEWITDIYKLQKVVLESGDVVIFDGKSRLIFHGVRGIFPNSTPLPLLEKIKLRPGRLNLTFRQF